MPAPSSTLLSVGWAGLTVETEVELLWMELELGRSTALVGESTATEVVLRTTVLEEEVVVVVVMGASVVLVLVLVLVVEVEVAGGGV